jgi:hypothetical protein
MKTGQLRRVLRALFCFRMANKNTRLSECEWQNLQIHSLFQQSPIGTTVSFNNHSPIGTPKFLLGVVRAETSCETWFEEPWIKIVIVQWSMVLYSILIISLLIFLAIQNLAYTCYCGSVNWVKQGDKFFRF